MGYKSEFRMDIKATDKTKAVMSNVQNNFRKTGRYGAASAQRTTAAWAKFQGMMSIARIGISAVQKAFESMERGAKANLVATAFKQLNKESGKLLKTMTTASRGLLDETTLQGLANKLFTLGLSADQMGQTMDAAFKISVARGLDLAQTMQTLTTSLATGRVTTLASMGVNVSAKAVVEEYAQKQGKLVKELSESEKKGALFAGSIDAINVAFKGLDVDDAVNRIQKVKKEIEDAQSAFDVAMADMGEGFLTAYDWAVEDLAEKSLVVKLIKELSGWELPEPVSLVDEEEITIARELVALRRLAKRELNEHIAVERLHTEAQRQAAKEEVERRIAFRKETEWLKDINTEITEAQIKQAEIFEHHVKTLGDKGLPWLKEYLSTQQELATLAKSKAELEEKGIHNLTTGERLRLYLLQEQIGAKINLVKLAHEEAKQTQLTLQERMKILAAEGGEVPALGGAAGSLTAPTVVFSDEQKKALQASFTKAKRASRGRSYRQEFTAQMQLELDILTKNLSEQEQAHRVHANRLAKIQEVKWKTDIAKAKAVALADAQRDKTLDDLEIERLKKQEELKEQILREQEEKEVARRLMLSDELSRAFEMEMEQWRQKQAMIQQTLGLYAEMTNQIQGFVGSLEASQQSEALQRLSAGLGGLRSSMASVNAIQRDSLKADTDKTKLYKTQTDQNIAYAASAGYLAASLVEDERTKAAIYAVMETAHGFATLSNPWISGGHFAAAGIYAGIAAMAGPGATAGKAKTVYRAPLAAAGTDAGMQTQGNITINLRGFALGNASDLGGHLADGLNAVVGRKFIDADLIKVNQAGI